MKLLTTLALSFLFLTVPFRSFAETTFRGEIADSSCATNVHSLTRSHQEMLKGKSMGTDANITPDNPPIKKTKKKPKHQSIGKRSCNFPYHIVATQQKNCVPVGITIIRLAAVKKLSLNCGKPVANM